MPVPPQQATEKLLETGNAHTSQDALRAVLGDSSEADGEAVANACNKHRKSYNFKM